MQIANIVMGVLFVVSAAVQFNDPDSAAWIAIYLAAAVACGVAWYKPATLSLPVVLLLICLAWAATLVPAVVGNIPFMDMFQAWEMKDVGIEQSREMYGLLMVGAWMLILAIVAIRSRRSLGVSSRRSFKR